VKVVRSNAEWDRLIELYQQSLLRYEEAGDHEKAQVQKRLIARLQADRSPTSALRASSK